MAYIEQHSADHSVPVRIGVINSGRRLVAA